MLTAQQAVDLRRWCGYPSLGTDTPANTSSDFAYGWVLPGVNQTLFARIAGFTPEVEATLISVYLTPLATLESAIPGAGDNLDTDAAAVWTHNKNEVNDRIRLFDTWRRRLCYFIGIPPGPSLGPSGLQISRC